MGEPGRRLVGSGVEVPLVTEETRRYVNLEDAASAPPLREVAEALEALLPWYSRVHRGPGSGRWCPPVPTGEARTAVRKFVGPARVTR